MRDISNFKKIYASFQGAGRHVYVRDQCYDDFNRVLNEYRGNFHMTSIFRQIVSLNANPLQGKGQNAAADIRGRRGILPQHHG